MRVDAAVLARLLPPPFRPQLVDGMGVAGSCLIRLAQLRPRFAPSFVGLTSENAAHRVASSGTQEARAQHSLTWQVTPLAVQYVQSSFFSDPARFPPGALAFDCALLMRNIAHEWHARGQLRASNFD